MEGLFATGTARPPLNPCLSMTDPGMARGWLEQWAPDNVQAWCSSPPTRQSPMLTPDAVAVYRVMTRPQRLRLSRVDPSELRAALAAVKRRVQMADRYMRNPVGWARDVIG